MAFISAKVGTRTDITVTRWNAYFEEPEDPSEVTHDGYAVFVMDNTGWDALTLYAWGNDLPELFGGWPGISPTGSVEIKGITYKYFDTGEANKGLVHNLMDHRTLLLTVTYIWKSQKAVGRK